MMMMLLLAAAAASATPQPGELKTYRDWTVGCDNGWRCQAGSLFPEPPDYDLDTAASMTILRDPGEGSEPTIAIEFDGDLSGKETVWIDGRAIGGGTANAKSASIDYDTQAAAVLAAAMLKGRVLEVRNADGTPVAHISLVGISAALRHMDDRQQRAGTRSALVARGDGTAVPMPPPLPVIRSGAESGTAFVASPEEIAAARAENGCDGDPDSPRAEVHVLDRAHSLLLLSCSAGAYNDNMLALVASAAGGARRIVPAAFDVPSDWSEMRGWETDLVNASYDESQGLLSSRALGRGIGDCGTAETMAWDGTRFRLIEASAMDACRGNRNWITLWRATLRRR